MRVRGEIRGGFFGREMVHPTFKAVEAGAPLPPSLTPVYPTTAQLPQPYLRKVVAASLARAPLQEVLPPQVIPAGLPSLRVAVETLHHPPADVSLHELEDGSHPAAQRLKFEELLAQQISQLASRAERALLRAPEIVPRPGGLHEKLLGVLPFGLTGASGAWWTRSWPTSPARGRCTGCCRATWAPARPSWPRWPPRWRWTPAGNAR